MNAGPEVDGDLTPEQRRRLQRTWRRLWLPQLLVLPAVFVVISVNDRFKPPTPRPGHHPLPAWVPVVIAAVLLVIVLPVEFWVLRRRFFTRATPGRALIISGERHEIRRVYRALRRGETVSKADRPIAQAYVDSAQRQMRAGPWFVIGLLVLGAVAVGLPVTTGRPVPWFVAVLMMLALVMFGVAFVQLRRALAGARRQGVVPRAPDGTPS